MHIHTLTQTYTHVYIPKHITHRENIHITHTYTHVPTNTHVRISTHTLTKYTTQERGERENLRERESTGAHAIADDGSRPWTTGKVRDGAGNGGGGG